LFLSSTDRISAMMSSGNRGLVVFIDQVKRKARGLTGSSAFDPLR
jgi:hypothetical protein